MKRQLSRRDKLILSSFIVYQVRGLVSNNRGKPVYIGPFDKVINDLYGLKDFSLRMSRLRNNYDILDLIEKIGLDQLVKLLQNSSYCNALRELTLINVDMKRVTKYIIKLRKKGKRDKSASKELSSLRKLYEKGTKAIRKRLGIRDIRESYKYRYENLRNFVEDRYGDDDWEFDSFGSFSGFEDDFEDFDDDYEFGSNGGGGFRDNDSSELERFLRKMTGEKSPDSERRYNRRDSYDDDYYEDDRQRSRRESFFEDVYDDEVDEYGDYHRNQPFPRRRDYAEDEYERERDDQLSALTDQVSKLSDWVQSLASQKEYDDVNGRNPVTHEYSEGPSSNVILAEIKKLQRATIKIGDEIDNIQDWANNVDEIINSLTEEEGYEEENDSIQMNPAVDFKEVVTDNIMNQEQGIQETAQTQAAEPRKLRPGKEQLDPEEMSTGELIDELNKT